MKTSPIVLRTILFVILILTVNKAFPQGKFELSCGYGWPDLSNLKIKYGKNIQIGASQSFARLGGDNPKIFLWTTAAEIYYHFGGKSKFTEQPPWYLMGGLGCVWGRDGDDNTVYLYPRLGRKINFSKRTGINLDAGAFIPLSKELGDFMGFPIWPSGSISFFIRL